MSMAELDAGVEERVCRELAVATLEELAHEARLRFAHSERTAFDLHMVDRREHTAGCLIEDTPTTSYRFEPDGRRLAQTWCVIDAVHANASAGNSMAQRELWYRLKPFGLFEKPQEVFDRIMDVCAVISLRCCMPCPREAIGVIAASRGSMIGTLSLWASDEEVVSMETRVHAIPGDPIKCSKMRFAESRARFIVVVEKDTVFTRLVDDGFIHALPCLLITARGFPDLATRALVQNAVESLRLPGVVLTDYNPHGMALMLNYKELEAATQDDASGGGEFAELLQPFGQRDHAVMSGLLNRSAVYNDAELLREAEAMQEGAHKLEIEALHGIRAIGSLSAFLTRLLVISGNQPTEMEMELELARGARHY